MRTGKESLSEQIHYLSILQQEYIGERFKQMDLHVVQARAINYISIYPGTIQKDLAAYLGKQNATVTNILKIMEKQDYIRRVIPDDNERQKKLYLTEKGTAAAVLIQKIFSDLDEQVNALITESERKAAADILKKLQGIQRGRE